jgi:hypothetical protein
VKVCHIRKIRKPNGFVEESLSTTKRFYGRLERWFPTVRNKLRHLNEVLTASKGNHPAP